MKRTYVNRTLVKIWEIGMGGVRKAMKGRKKRRGNVTKVWLASYFATKKVHRGVGSRNWKRRVLKTRTEHPLLPPSTNMVEKP